MTTPGGIGPERLGEIVNGALPRDDEERAMLALMEETRALEPGASDELRQRVLEGPPPAPVSRRVNVRRWLGAAGGDERRRLLVAGPVVAGIIALAVVIPVLNDGGSPDGPVASAGSAAATVGAAGSALAPESSTAAPSAGSAAGTAGSDFRTAAPAAADAAKAAAGVAPTAQAPVPASGRARQLTATTRVQVGSVEALSKASASAMRTVRGLGGFTASSDYSVPNGAEGTNRLVFRVPVARAQDALAAFGRLGTVTGQNADIVDLTARLGRQKDRVETLTATVADLRAQLAANPGDAVLAAKLTRAESALARAEADQAATLSRTSLATLRLTLTTQGPPAPAAQEGRFGGPLSRAGNRLADATAWLLGAIVLVGPFILLALVIAWGVMRLRGRSDRRLMGSA